MSLVTVVGTTLGLIINVKTELASVKSDVAVMNERLSNHIDQCKTSNKNDEPRRIVYMKPEFIKPDSLK